MRKFIYLIVLGMGIISANGQIYRPEGVNIPGAWCNWSNPPSKMVFAGDSQRTAGMVHYITDQSKRYHTTFYIDTVNGADTGAGTYGFLFTSGPTSNYWQNKWAKTSVVIDSLQSYTYQGNTDNSISVTNGSWYTVNFEDKGYNNSRAIFMRTSAKPVTIDSASHPGAYVLKTQPPTISIYLSDTPSVEEIIYLRYSNDGWNTSTLIQASINGSVATAQLPSFTQGDTIRYYIFTSTKSIISGDYGLYTINYLLNNKKYIVTDKFASITWVSDTTLCPGSAFNIAYQSVSGYNQGNNLTVYMSDSSASFNNAIAVGSKSTAASSDTISCSIPVGYQSAGYKIYMISDSPTDTSNVYNSTFSIKPTPAAQITNQGNLKICLGDSLKLTAKPGINYQYIWRKNGSIINGATDSFYFANDSADYDVIVSNSCGSDTSVSTYINLSAKPNPNILSGGVNRFCYGDSLTLFAAGSGNLNFQWYNGGNSISGAIFNQFTVYNTGSYSLKVTDTVTGCTAESGNFNITANNCNIIYSPEGINMPGTWNAWNNPPSNKPAFASSRQVQGGKIILNRTGTRRYTTRFHIDSLNADTMGGNYKFLFTSGPATNYWQNKWGDVSVVLDSLQFYTIKGSTDNDILVTNGHWYTMNFEDNGYNSARGIFMETPAAPVSIDSVTQNPTIVYANNPVSVSFELSAKPSAKEYFYIRYSNDRWQTSSLQNAQITGNAGNAIIPATGISDTVSYYVFSSVRSSLNSDYDLYTLEMNNNGGLNYEYISKSQFISIDSISNTVICAGDSLEIYFSSGNMNSGNYFSAELSDNKGSFAFPKTLKTWRDSLSGKVYVTIPNNQPAGSNFRIRIASSSPQITSLPNNTDITINASPSDQIYISGKTAVCIGDSVKIGAQANNSYLYEWYRDNTKIGNDSFIYAALAGKYYAIITAPNSCITKTNSKDITVNNGKPTANITALGNTSFCDGGSVKLNAGYITGQTYQWRYNFADINGATDTIYIANQTGSYEVFITNGCGTQLSAAITVYANPYPNASIIGKQHICQGESTYLITKFDSVYTYQWLRNDTLLTGANDDSLLAKISGNYGVIVTNPFGCSDTAIVTLTVDPAPDASITASGSTNICQGSTVTLNANSGFITYQWYLNGNTINGANGQAYAAGQAGDYTVWVTTSIGCKATTINPVKVKVNPLPNKPTITQIGGILSASSALSYQWSLNTNIISGATQKDYNPGNIGGSYTVTITDSNGCQATSDPFVYFTGISETSGLHQVKLYPNPTNGNIYLENPGDFHLMDISGKIITGLPQVKLDQLIKIDLSNLPAGLYIIKTSQQVFRVNLIK